MHAASRTARSDSSDHRPRKLHPSQDPRSLAQVEREAIERTVEATGSKTEAAKVLEISRKTLRDKLAQGKPTKGA